MKQSLLHEMLDFNKKLGNIIEAGEIDITNEVAFIFFVKSHKAHKELMLPVLIYLCDSRYIFENIWREGKSFHGKIARYVILQMDINKFIENLISIRKRNYDKNHMKQKIKELIEKTYDKYNYSDEQLIPSSLNCFIYKNIRTGIINKYQCFEQMRLGNFEYECYVRKVLRSILGYLDDEFIYNVEFVRDFYICLKKIIEHEFREESLKVITEYMCTNYL